jgi:hypothetical protein
LQQAAAALKKQRVAAGLGDYECEGRESQDKGRKQCLTRIAIEPVIA